VLLERTRAAGSDQVIAVELTHATLGVPVAKVIVPGRAGDVEALG
jgi:ribosomal protein S12 methylthiotransferase accessory factor YcaO